jgi:hypothetical protein
MRRWLTVVYVVAALVAVAPALGFVVAMHASPWGPRPLDFAIATLLNPLLIGELGLATWYGSIAWRSAQPRAFVGRRELRAAEAVAALLGAWLAWTGAAAVESQRASAARGGALLGGFGEAMLAAGVIYLLLAAWSFGVRALAQLAAHAGEAMRPRALAIVYAVVALLLLGPTLRMLAMGLLAFPVRGYAYLALVLAFYPPTGLSVVFGSWFATIAWRRAKAREGDDGERVGELRLAEWLATAIAVLLLAIFWSQRAAPRDADPTFAVTMALATAAFVVVAIGSRLGR